TVEKFDIHLWIRNFIARLEEVKESQTLFNARRVSEAILDQIQDSYRQANRRLIFLDYDGTLVNFTDDPGDAAPDAALINLLAGLAKDTRNRIVLISGRKRDTLDEWFPGLNLDMVAEHGAWIKMQGK